MFCTHCGKGIPEGSKFCAGCGKPATGADEIKPPVSSQSAGAPPETAPTVPQAANAPGKTTADKSKKPPAALIIIVVVAAVVISATVSVVVLLSSYNSSKKVSQRRTCQANLRTIDGGIQIYYVEYEKYPESVDQLVSNDTMFLKTLPQCPSGTKPYELRGEEQPHAYCPNVPDHNFNQ